MDQSDRFDFIRYGNGDFLTPSDGSFLVVAKVNWDEGGDTLHVGAMNADELQAHYSAHASKPRRLSYRWNTRKCSYIKEIPSSDANEMRLSFSACVLPFFVILTCLCDGFHRRLRTKCLALHTVGVAVNEAKRTWTSLVVFLSLLDWRLFSCPSVILGVPTSTNSTRLKVQSLRASLMRHFAVSSLVGYTSATGVEDKTSQKSPVNS